MKHLIIAFALLFSVAAGAQTLTIELATTTIETSTKSLTYPTEALYFTYNSSTGTFTAREVNSTNLLYTAGISTVTLDTFTTATAKLDALEYTHILVSGGLTSTYVPRNNISMRQRYPFLEIWPANAVSKTPLWSGKADSVPVFSTEWYPQAVGQTDYLHTAFDANIEASLEASGAVGDSLGSGGSVSVFGNQLAGHITLGSGTGPKATGPLAVITLPRQFATGFYVLLQERNATGAVYRSRIYADAGPYDTNQFTIAASGTALPNGATLEYDYFVIGYTFLD